MKKNLSLLLLMCLLSSCTIYHYYPTRQVVPTDTKKNQVKVMSSTDDDVADVGISYSITDYLGVYVDMSSFSAYDELSDEGAYVYDFGIYYYDSYLLDNTPLGKTMEINFTYAVALDYGIGENNSFKKYYEIDFQRGFLQPSVAITSKFIDFGISSRVSCIDYKIDAFYGNVDDSNRYEPLQDVGEESFFFFEPSFFIGIGYKGLKLNYHETKVIKMNDAEIQYRDCWIPFLSLNLQLDIDNVIKKTKQIIAKSKSK